MSVSLKKIVSGYYHCKVCDSLYESQVDGVSELKCKNCGSMQFEEATVTSQKTVFKPKSKSLDEDRGKSNINLKNRKDKQSKNNNNIRFVLIVFTLVLLASAVGLVIYSNDITDSSSNVESAEIVNGKSIPDIEEGDVEACLLTFRSFEKSEQIIDKTIYAYQGAKLAYTMSNYYRDNPIIRGKTGNFYYDSSFLMNITHPKIITLLVQFEEGAKQELSFIQSEEDWKLDWESYVRYNKVPFSSFINGEDGDEAECRLYIKWLDIGDKRARENLTFLLYPPSAYQGGEISSKSSMPLFVPVESDLAKELEHLTTINIDEVKKPYIKNTRAIDPENYHRVRLKLRLRKEVDREASLELVDVLADHWFGIELNDSQEAEPDLRE